MLGRRRRRCTFSAGKGEPLADHALDRLHLIVFQHTEKTHRSRDWHSLNTLAVERPGLQEERVDLRFILSSTDRSRVRNDGEDGTIDIADYRADHHAGPRLRGDPKIDKPHFLPNRISHFSSSSAS